MQHIGIDLGGRQSQVCVRSAAGEILEESKVSNDRLPDYFKRYPKARVILETCAEAFKVADLALSAGEEVRVVPASVVRSLGVGSRRIKTDQRDAQVLSEVSTRIDLLSVHIPSQPSRELKSRLGMRDQLVKCRTQLVNNLRGYYRGRLQKLRATVVSLPERLRERELPNYVERQLSVLTLLNEQIRAANQELESLAMSDELCQRLMSVPGVGVITALRFISTIDRIERFRNCRELQSYLGLTPGENSSSEKKRITGITRAGSASMRWLLIEAAWVLQRTQPEHPRVAWAQALAERRGKRIATVALARKLTGMLYAIWRDGSIFAA